MDDALSLEELNSVRKLAFSADRFEPFAAAVIPARLLRRLVAGGLAEGGHSCRPAVGAIGYRLTADGWRIASANWKKPWSKTPRRIREADDLRDAGSPSQGRPDRDRMP